jgi:4-hydroxy-3-methylbut-2-enyl diphosphate reductase
VITQTTLSLDDVAPIVDALSDSVGGLRRPAAEDICYATQNRQEAVKDLSAEARVVLVLGSQNSSNSKRLADIGGQGKRTAYLIDTVSDLRDEWFRPDDVVLVTAGASAPEENVQEVVNHLRHRYGATVETRTVREEHVSFPLPRELRNLPVLRNG